MLAIRLPEDIATELLPISAIRLFSAHRAASEYLRRHLAQPSRGLGDEMAVPLILGNELSDVGKRLAREDPKVPIFAGFGVVCSGVG
ncbi:MAG TPA: hypothetical protein VIC30_11295 [Orrella sp.]